LALKIKSLKCTLRYKRVLHLDCNNDPADTIWSSGLSTVELNDLFCPPYHEKTKEQETNSEDEVNLLLLEVSKYLKLILSQWKPNLHQPSIDTIELENEKTANSIFQLENTSRFLKFVLLKWNSDLSSSSSTINEKPPHNKKLKTTSQRTLSNHKTKQASYQFTIDSLSSFQFQNHLVISSSQYSAGSIMI
jgi:hypothetical protein